MFKSYFGFTVEELNSCDFDWSQLSLDQISSIPAVALSPYWREFSDNYV